MSAYSGIGVIYQILVTLVLFFFDDSDLMMVCRIVLMRYGFLFDDL